MGRKHLHELLEQDQEPFQLKNFIADRRSLLKSTTTDAGKTALRLRKRNPVIEPTSSSTTARNFCINHVCLLSFQDSPDFRKSPFVDFSSKEIKSPCNNAAVFINIPARTAAMLLDAATRVQKPKTGSKHNGFGLLGSFLRRLKDRSTRTKRREIGPVYETPTSAPPRRRRKKILEVDGGGDENRLPNMCNDSRLSSVVWSENSSELETSCTSRSIHYTEEIECLCSNPSSPFRFSLQRTPSPTRRKPDSSSPVASPSRHFQQDNQSYEGEHPQEIRESEDNEKEQCSPVSILDPLFDDDDDEHEDRVTDEDDYDIESSYAIVQRAKQQLLQKLRRFERLAGLDPIELERHMLEQHYDDNEDDDELIMAHDEDELTKEEFVREIFNHLDVGKIPWYMKKLVFDLISEENKNEERQVVVQRVCKRLYSWKVVELNTIDMMVGEDFGCEDWKNFDDEKFGGVGVDIEEGIFSLLMEDLAQELVKSSRNVIFED